MSADIFSRREREGRIREAISSILTDNALREIFTFETLPDFRSALPLSGEVRERFQSLCAKVATALKDSNLCEPCPNIGFHQIESLEAWNRFVRGEISADDPAMKRVPLFRVMDGITLSVAHASQKSNGGCGDQETFVLNLSRRLIRAIASEDDLNLVSITINSRLDHALNLEIAESPLRPVIHMIPDGNIGEGTPLPVCEEPRPARHLTLSVPSKRLAVVSWLSIPAFESGLLNLMGGEIPETSTPGGIDRKTRSIYENAGIVSIHVGSMPPQVLVESQGVWRAGHVDDRQVDPADLPEFAWSSIGPAHLMADVDVFLDVMMASCLYSSREEAIEELSIAEEQEEFSVVELDSDTLHIYTPTGYGLIEDRFSKIVRMNGFEYPVWRTDAYILSMSELDVTSGTLEDHDWKEGRVDPALTRRPESETGPRP